MYASPSDPKIERDTKAYEKACESFARKYAKNKNYTTSAGQLLKAITEYEALEALPNPIIYFYLFLDINGGHKVAEANKSSTLQRLTKASNHILFFHLSLAAIPAKQQKAFLVDPKLKDVRYFLKRIFDSSKYNLSEAEEKILNLKSIVAREKWIEGQEKLLGKQTISWQGKTMPIAEAQGKIKELPTKQRYELHSLVMQKYMAISDFAESEINAVVIDKKINDELRGYKMPYSATIFHYQNDEKAVESLVATTTKYFHIAHRFHKIKAKMLGLPKLRYADRAASVGGTVKKISYDEARVLVQKAFASLGQKYEDVFMRYLENGQIDVFPKVGKKSGAYCWTNINRPTYVLLNHIDNLNSVMILAHEMGHAIHCEFSKSQRPMYQGHSTAVAEVASTLFENFAFEEVLKTLSDKEKIVALHDKISDDISTIFRQIACFNFETELHATIRNKGSMSKEDIAKLMNKHMKAYLGPAFDLKDEDGYFFVTWSHIRSFFYVYSYAYGQLISKALYKKYQEDPSYLSKIEQFLYAGESMSPEDIFKSAGIDTTKPGFFEAGLMSIEDDIKRLETMLKKQKK